MSGGGAHVGSFDAVRHFRAVMNTFSHDAREALNSFDTEVARTLAWLLEEMPQYWKNEIRRSDELLQEARIDLERCRNTPLPGGGTPSCIEQKKALDKAKARKLHAEEKFEATRRWGKVAEREAAEYSGRSNQLGSLFDAELPKAILVLDRVLKSLEAYQSLRAPSTEAPLTGSTAGLSDTGTAGATAARLAPAATTGGGTPPPGQKPPAGGDSATGPQANGGDSEHTKHDRAGGDPQTAAGSS